MQNFVVRQALTHGAKVIIIADLIRLEQVTFLEVRYFSQIITATSHYDFGEDLRGAVSLVVKQDSNFVAYVAALVSANEIGVVIKTINHEKQINKDLRQNSARLIKSDSGQNASNKKELLVEL